MNFQGRNALGLTRPCSGNRLLRENFYLRVSLACSYSLVLFSILSASYLGSVLPHFASLILALAQQLRSCYPFSSSFRIFLESSLLLC